MSRLAEIFSYLLFYGSGMAEGEERGHLDNDCDGNYVGKEDAAGSCLLDRYCATLRCGR